MNEDKPYSHIEVIEMNNYVLPDISPDFGKKWTTNGQNNEFFQYVKEKYNGSPTNAGIIKAYVNYIIGEGIIDKGGKNINKYLDKNDLRKICLDFKMYGQFSFQVIWSQGSKLLKQDPEPIKFKYVNTAKLALSLDGGGQIDGYWYSYDWSNQGKFKPAYFSKFDGNYKENSIEIITFNRVSTEDYFPNPDYLSGLQWAHLEEEMANSAISGVLNGFSAGRIINVKGGVPPTEELRNEYTSKILSKLTGSTNKNKVIVSFSNGLDSGSEIEVTNIQTDQLDNLLVYHSEQAQKMLLVAHSVTSPILFGIQQGFSLIGSNKDEMREALKTLYRSNINPMREVIIDGLELLMRTIDPSISLEFKDFEELLIEEEAPQNNMYR